MSHHKTRWAEQHVEIVAIHPRDADGYVRLEVFHDDDHEMAREADVDLTPEQAREVARQLIRHAELAEREWRDLTRRPYDRPICPGVIGNDGGWYDT